MIIYLGDNRGQVTGSLIHLAQVTNGRRRVYVVGMKSAKLLLDAIDLHPEATIIKQYGCGTAGRVFRRGSVVSYFLARNLSAVKSDWGQSYWLIESGSEAATPENVVTALQVIDGNPRVLFTQEYV